jgi:HSP20 family protein
MPNPRDIHRMQDELDELFADLWQVPSFVGRRRGFRPHVDCYRSDAPPAVTAVVELAGIDPEDIEIVVTERTVVVSGVRKRAAHSCRVSYRQMEIEYGPFQRRIALAEDVDPEGAEATYEGGLLTVVIPVAQRAQTGRVTIALGGKGAKGQA